MNIEKKFKQKFIFNKKGIFRFLYFFFNKYVSLFKYKKSYSQGSMDLIISDIFKKKTDGIYVDVGCQHPIQNNNTFKLFKKGWKGINIDLDDFNIELFKFHRPNDYNVNIAVSDSIGKEKLYFYHKKSPINTLNKKISDSQNAELKNIIDVDTDTLSNIIERSSYKKIDLLSIDVEGHELKVLKGLEFNKYKPRVIVVEFLDLNSKKWEIPFNNFLNVQSSDLYNFLISKNYKFVNWVNGDLVFISETFED